jgi:hypothetical protein
VQHKPSQASAIARVNACGALLVYPIHNRELPRSLWSEFFPDVRMVWDWNDDADGRVGEMWNLMKRLSDCREVIYSKWYQGRATLFSHELFEAMLAVQRSRRNPRRALSPAAAALLQVLENNSPLSTRILKEWTGLRGRLHETEYSGAMKELFSRLRIVGFGEVEDGAFPSLAIGATELLFDDVWRSSEALSIRRAHSTIERFLPAESHFRRFFEKTLSA